MKSFLLLVVIAIGLWIWVGSKQSARRAKVVAAHSAAASEAAALAEAVADHRIIVGMSAAQVRASWGNPQHSERRTGPFGTRDIYAYNSANSVSLLNGAVENVNESNEGNPGVALRNQDAQRAFAVPSTPSWGSALDKGAYQKH